MVITSLYTVKEKARLSDRCFVVQLDHSEKRLNTQISSKFFQEHTLNGALDTALVCLEVNVGFSIYTCILYRKRKKIQYWITLVKKTSHEMKVK